MLLVSKELPVFAVRWRIVPESVRPEVYSRRRLCGAEYSTGNQPARQPVTQPADGSGAIASVAAALCRGDGDEEEAERVECRQRVRFYNVLNAC